MQTIRRAADWIVANWATIAICWTLISAALSAVWRAIPEPSRQRLAQRYPRVDAAARIVRKAGLDLIPVVLEGIRLLTGKRLPPIATEDDRPTDPPDPPKPPSPPAATPSAGLLALLVVCVLACGPHPWHVTARATINAHAHALAAADAVLAQAIASDPSTDPEAIRVHWERAVHGLRIAREFLVTAESGVLAVAGTESEPEKCRALRGVEAALGVAVQSLASLSSVGVQVPGELREATAQSSTLSELALRLCRADGGGL